MRRLASFLRSFFGDRRGNFAIIFALTLTPIAIAAAASVDISRAYIVETRLKAALDAAALAVGTASGLSSEEVQAIAQAYFDANYPEEILGVPGVVTVSDSLTTVDISVTAELPTVMMGLVGIKSLDVVAVSQVMRHGKKLEVVLVLDNTGSMNSGGRLTVLKAAAKDLIDTVSAAAVTPGDVRIGIVPFSTDVNVGTANKDASWLKWTWEHSPECTNTGSWWNPKITCVDERTVSKSGWKGCVVDRDEDYDVSVSVPTANNATKFPANSNNTYNNNCSLRPVVPLSTNFSSLKSEIDNMQAGGATNTTIGFAWGWQLLTNGAILSNAAVADPDEIDKVMVYLTDGDNTYYRQGIGSCNGSSDCPGVDARTALVCNNIRNAGIQVYTVRLVNGNATLLRNCATNPGMYYSVNTAADLTDVFKSIAQALSNLRLSK